MKMPATTIQNNGWPRRSAVRRVRPGGTEDRISAPFPDCLSSIGDRQSRLASCSIVNRRLRRLGPFELGRPVFACRATRVVRSRPCRIAHPMRNSSRPPLPSVTCEAWPLRASFRLSKRPIPRDSPTPVEQRIPVIRRRSLLSPLLQSQPRTSSRVDLTRAAPRSGRAG
jgi:hypothetical protein